MKFKMILILLFIQVAIVTKTKAQFFGVSNGTVFTPLSTLDVRGTFGANLFKDTSSTSTSSAAAAIILNSALLYSNLTGLGRTSLQIPAASSAYLNRVYIIANGPSNSGGKTWELQNGVFYYDLFNIKTLAVPVGTSVIIICDGTQWLQIN